MKVLVRHACPSLRSMHPILTRAICAHRQSISQRTQSTGLLVGSMRATQSSSYTSASVNTLPNHTTSTQKPGKKALNTRRKVSKTARLNHLRTQIKTSTSHEFLAKLAMTNNLTNRERYELVFQSPVRTHHVTEGLAMNMDALFEYEHPEALIKQIALAHDLHSIFGRTSLGRNVRREFYSNLEAYALQRMTSSDPLGPKQVVDITRAFSRKSAKEAYSPRRWFSWLGDEVNANYGAQQLATIAYACGLSSMYIPGLTPAVAKMLESLSEKKAMEIKHLDLATALRAYFAMVRLNPDCGAVLGEQAVKAFSSFIPQFENEEVVEKNKRALSLKPDEVALYAWTTCSTPAVNDPSVKEALLYLLSHIGSDRDLVDGGKHTFETTTFMPQQLMSMTYQVYLSVVSPGEESLSLDACQQEGLAKVTKLFASGGRDDDTPETPNRSEIKLAQAVKALDLGGVEQQFLAANGYSIDVAVPEKKLAFEFQGPTHFSSAPAMTNQRIPMAGLRLKQRHLKAEGWRVVHIPFWEWAELRVVDRSKYLIDKIKTHKNKLPVGEPKTSAHFAKDATVPDFEVLETPNKATLWKSVGNYREDRHNQVQGSRPTLDAVMSYLAERKGTLSARSAALLAQDHAREYNMSPEQEKEIEQYLLHTNNTPRVKRKRRDKRRNRRMM